MRYNILNSKVVESMFIDAPYDTRRDALETLNSGITHNCERCTDIPGEHEIDTIYNESDTDLYSQRY
jgi:hypothetical protein